MARPATVASWPAGTQCHCCARGYGLGPAGGLGGVGCGPGTTCCGVGAAGGAGAIRAVGCVWLGTFMPLRAAANALAASGREKSQTVRNPSGLLRVSRP